MASGAIADHSRIGFDFGCLLCVVHATGAHPQPWLVLLAYAAANVFGLIHLTPGGQGIVEASLGSLLVLAGVPSGSAFVATLTYCLLSYWLPILVGGPAYLIFRHRYGAAWRRSPAHQTGKQLHPGHPLAPGCAARRKDAAFCTRSVSIEPDGDGFPR